MWFMWHIFALHPSQKNYEHAEISCQKNLCVCWNLLLQMQEVSTHAQVFGSSIVQTLATISSASGNCLSQTPSWAVFFYLLWMKLLWLDQNQLVGWHPLSFRSPLNCQCISLGPLGWRYYVAELKDQWPHRTVHWHFSWHSMDHNDKSFLAVLFACSLDTYWYFNVIQNLFELKAPFKTMQKIFSFPF